MALVTTKEMFKKAYEGKYAIGAFNINNMEIIQAITEAAAEEKSPVILQVSAGARKYAKHAYLMALAKAAVEDSGVDLALHLDHGADFEVCKSCIDGGFTSVMIDGSHHSFEDNIALTKKVVASRRFSFIFCSNEISISRHISVISNGAMVNFLSPACIRERSRSEATRRERRFTSVETILK